MAPGTEKGQEPDAMNSESSMEMKVKYRRDEIESYVLDGVIDRLLNEYQGLLSKKEALSRDLLRVVEEKVRELQQCELESEEQERELELRLWDKLQANKKVVEEAERIIEAERKQVEELVTNLEDRKQKMEEWLGGGGAAIKNELEDRIAALEEAKKKAEEMFRKDQDFIYNLWEHYRSIYIKNEHENVNALLTKYLNDGLDKLTENEKFAIRERFRMEMELEKLISAMFEQRNESKIQEKKSESYRREITKLSRKFYNLFPMPEWSFRMGSLQESSRIRYALHEEEDLCEHEYPFKVPLTVETVWANYEIPEDEREPEVELESSMKAEPGGFVKEVDTIWKFNKAKVMVQAHGSEVEAFREQSRSFEMDRKVRFCLHDQ